MALTSRAVLVALLGLVPVVLAPGVLTVWAWVLLLVALVALDVALAPRPDVLELVRGRTPQVRLGGETSSELYVTHRGSRRARGVLRDAWPPSTGALLDRHRLDLRAGERALLVSRLRPTRRGDRQADRVTIRLVGPLGLAGRQASREVPGRIRVMHPFDARRHLPSRLAALRQLDGRAALRTRGQGTEFDSLRDYVAGDDVRSLDWRATARRQHPVVRTWRPEEHRRVVLVVDTSRTSAGRIGDVPRLDAAMDAALLLAALAGHARDRVQVIAGDQRVRARASGHDRSTLLTATVEALSDVEPALVEADWGRLATEVTRASTQRALVVLLTPLEPAAIEEGLMPVLPVLTARHRVVLAAVADPTLREMREARGSLTEVYGAVAAERSGQLRERTADALGRLGVTVLEGDPDRLPPMLADHYLALKARGLL